MGTVRVIGSRENFVTLCHNSDCVFLKRIKHCLMRHSVQNYRPIVFKPSQNFCRSFALGCKFLATISVAVVIQERYAKCAAERNLCH